MARIARLGEVPAASLLLCGHPLCRARLSTRLLCRQLGVLARRAGGAAGRRGCDGAERDQVGNSLRDRRNDVFTQLVVLSLILLLQSEALLLAHVGTTDVLDFLHNVKHDLFGAAVAFIGILALSNISASHVSGAVNGEGNAVGHLLAPTLGI